MPYVKQEIRDLLDPHIDKLVAELKQDIINPSPGINYVITKIITGLEFQPNYMNFNAILGALECAKLEYYARKVRPYEDTKIKENGDVY